MACLNKEIKTPKMTLQTTETTLKERLKHGTYFLFLVENVHLLSPSFDLNSQSAAALGLWYT